MKRSLQARILLLLLAFGLLAASCSAPEVIVTSEATITSTLHAPPQTLTPTADLATATPTKDPTIPEGATGKDNKGNWIKVVATENGNTLTYTYDTERKSFYRPIFTGYLMDVAKEINDKNTIYSQDGLLQKISIDHSIAGEMSLPTLTHKDNTDLASTINFDVYFGTRMANALVDRGILQKNTDFNMLKWVNRELYLDFTNADGPQRWGLWPGSTINVHIRGDFDALKTNMATNGYAEVQGNNSYGPPILYMAKIWTDKDGNLYWDIAPNSTTWTEKQYLEMLYFGWATVFENTDVTQPVSGSELRLFVQKAAEFPYFDFGPSQ